MSGADAGKQLAGDEMKSTTILYVVIFVAAAAGGAWAMMQGPDTAGLIGSILFLGVLVIGIVKVLTRPKE